MKNLKDIIIERLHITKDTGNQVYNYHPKTKDELKELVVKLIKERGNDADLNDIDTSKITDMSYMFDGSEFNGDISKWDVSNVTNMQTMFADSKFTGENGDISNWDVSNVENMHCMFNGSKFNGNISNWNVQKVKHIEMMFYKSNFTGNLNNWDIDLDKIDFYDKYKIFTYSPLEKNPPKWYKE